MNTIYFHYLNHYIIFYYFTTTTYKANFSHYKPLKYLAIKQLKYHSINRINKYFLFLYKSLKLNNFLT